MRDLKGYGPISSDANVKNHGEHSTHVSPIENEFKASRFNEFLGCLNGKWVIYNNFSGGLIEVNPHIYDSLLNNRVDDIKNDNQIK